MNYPRVSLVTATYGRCPTYQHLLEEVLECFRLNREHYPGECELVLVNDHPEQTLTTDLPGVRILNVKERFPTLGEKLNYGIEQASGEIILPQDDDDISLAHRASL